MPREQEKMRRKCGSTSIMMIDIDRFKLINDTFGHLHGDGILRECAAMLNRSVRASDILVRFGGDEFLVVMADSSNAAIETLIARINSHLDEWNVKYGSENYMLSFSIGHASISPDEDFIIAIENADKNMFAAKIAKRSHN